MVMLCGQQFVDRTYLVGEWLDEKLHTDSDMKLYDFVGSCVCSVRYSPYILWSVNFSHKTDIHTLLLSTSVWMIELIKYKMKLQ